MVINEIIWLNSIIEKIMWKHNIIPLEVEEALENKGEDMQKNKIIKKNMSIEEASAFWDEHDISEFKNVEEVKDIQFKLKKKKYIGVSYNLYKKLDKKAKEMHKSCESLIEDWLKEKIAI